MIVKSSQTFGQPSFQALVLNVVWVWPGRAVHGVGDGVLEAAAVEVLAARLAVGDGPAAQPHQLARGRRRHGRHQETLDGTRL